MINTELAKVTHTTVADQSARYPISFKYDVLPDTLAPELLVTLDGNPLTYGTDYTVDAAGLQLVNAPEANKTLVIKRDVSFTQEMDFQTGLIDPDQIEDGFDRAVMRDQELKQNVLDVAAALAAEADERTTADTLLQDAIDTKQDIIADLATIRSGASAGATAVQPGDLATVATSGSYNDLSNRPTIPSVGAGVITITQGGVAKGSFNVNQNGDTTIEVDEGGGGAVDSVNGKVGVVVLNSSDVGALPNTTKYAASLVLSVNPTTFVVTAQLKDQNNNNIGTAQTIDLPLESVVVSGAYDSVTKEVVLTLEGGSTIRFSVADLVSGLQTEITSVNMLSADLVDDSNSVHKFVTAADKTTWSGKQDYISDLSTIRAGASAGATALQASDNVSELVNDAGYLVMGDLTGFVTRTTAQTISGLKTFTADIVLSGTTSIKNTTNSVSYTMLYRDTSGIHVGTSTQALLLAGSGTRPTFNSNDVAMLSDVPTAVSQLTNDSGFITSADLPSAEAGTVGYVYTKTATGAEWAQPSGGTTITIITED